MINGGKKLAGIDISGYATLHVMLIMLGSYRMVPYLGEQVVSHKADNKD